MKNKYANSKMISVIVTLTLVLLMIPLDVFLVDTYWFKAVYKILLFVVIPICINAKWKYFSFRSLFGLKKTYRIKLFLFTLGVYVVILSLYIVIRPYIDFSQVTVQLESSMGITANNFIWVALYIPLVNAWIEEFFFRGIAYLSVKSKGSKKATWYSAVLFSFYHVGIMISWFNIGFYLLLLACLIVVGLLFNEISKRTSSILPTYLIHLSANVAINTIALDLFGIIQLF